MGNTASGSDDDGKDTSGLDDLSCLEIQNSAIFNDAYASELYASLPEYEGTEIEDAAEETGGQSKDRHSKMTRLLEVFGKSVSSVPCVSDFQELCVGAEPAHAEFMRMVKVRSRLLQRIHVAYSRKFNTSKASKTGGVEERFLRSSRKGGAGFDNPDALLTATSIKMSLSIMACLGPQNPLLFKQFSASLQDLLGRCPPLALSQVLDGSPHDESVRAIAEYAAGVVAQSQGEDRAHALSLMLSLAVSAGSLGGVLKMAMHLKAGTETLPSSAAPFLWRLEAMNTELKLSWPTPATVIGDFRAKLSVEADSEPAASCSCSSAAGDGVHLFVWNGQTRSIVKMGTGFHGSIAGNEYAVNADVESQLKERLGAAIYGSADSDVESDTDGAEADEAVPAAVAAPRRLVMTAEGIMVTVEEGADLEECFGNEDFEDSTMVEQGFEADIVSEHMLEYPGSGESCTVYGIGDNRYVVSVEQTEVEPNYSDSDNSDCCSDEVRYDRVVNVIEPTGSSARGDATTRAQLAKAYKPACLASANGKLYLWMSYLLGPLRVAVFSTSALKLEDIIDVRLPIAELVKGRRRWVRSLEGAEESKEEGALQEEKDGECIDEGDDTADVGENDLETSLGPEQALNSPETVRVATASTRALAMDLEDELPPLMGDANLSLEGNHPAYIFADGDEDQSIVVDLGGMYAPRRFGAKLHRNGDEEVKITMFEVWLSANNIEFFKYGSCDDLTATDLRVHPAPEGQVYPGPSEVQFVKYRFGSKPVAITKLFASGCPVVKVARSLPCPVMCSDGRYLTFLSANRASQDDEDPEPKLRVTVVDPLHRMTVVKDVMFDYGTSFEELGRATFATNGESLLMVHRLGFKEREKNEKHADYTCVTFNLLTHKEEGSHRVSFSEKAGYPQAVTYDARNNCIWSWDSFESRVLRWRNKGYAPRFLPPRPGSMLDRLLSEYPQYRLEALAELTCSDETKAAAEAANILCQIDRLAEVHSPPILPMAESRTRDEIEVVSAGFEDGCLCRLMHRGQILHEAGRGFNIALLNDQFEVVDSRTFDTHGSEAASDRMADFIDGMEEGSVVLVGVMDSAKAELSSRAISALKSLGADRVEKLTNRGSFALIGCKGSDAGSAGVVQAMLAKKEGMATVKQRIPSPKVPLVVDSSPSTLKTLVGLITEQYKLFKDKKATDIDKVVLLTCIRLCTTNIFHLLRGSPADEISGFLEQEERSNLISFVMELINDPPKDQGGMVIARSALRLFVTAIDVLYVSAADKCSLLIQYLKEFVDGTLSALEESVLELLLRQMSNPVSLSKILKANDPTLLVASLASIAEKETLSKLDNLSLVDGTKIEGDVGDASVQMLSTLCNMILSQGTDDFMSSPEVDTNVQAGVGSIIQLFLQISEISASVMTKATAGTGGEPLDKEADELMKNSPAGALLPIVLFNVARIATVSGEKFLAGCDTEALSEKLGSCLACVQKVLSKLPKKDLSQKVVIDSCVPKVATQIIQSPHPYESNSDMYWDINFPGAMRFTIAFDGDTKLERNYDYVIIWKDSSKQEKWHPDVEKYTGRGGSENYAGINGKPPLVIEGDSAYVEFHSDGSNEDWGFRFTATAEFKPSAPSVQRHWAFDLERLLGYCGSRVAAAMIVGVPWVASVEKPYMNIIEDDMVQGEFRKEVDPTSIPDNMKLLFDLGFGRMNPEAVEFCKKMKKKVMEDRGQVEDINRAVYATAAVLIKYNGLAAEAQALCNGTRDAPSDALVKVWKSSQKMRHYFDLSDLKAVQSSDVMPPAPPGSDMHTVDDDDDLPPPIGLTRGPSLYSGAGADTKRNASDCVVARCQFLLHIDDGIPESDSMSNPSAGKKMWQLLSKSTTKIAPKLQRDVSIENKWHNVVGAAQFANHLKELISYRRMAAQRKGGSASITERVLSFVQSNASVTQLELVRVLRDKRAKYRALGLQLLNHLIGCNASPFCVSLLVSCVQRAFFDSQSPERPLARAHYLNCIEGCSPALCGEVVGHFSNFIRGCTSYVESAYGQLSINKDDGQSQKSIILACLKSMAFDYDTTTHNILLKANIVSMINALTRSTDDEISEKAWSLYELLLLRCSGASHPKEIPDEPSDFTANVLSFLISELDKATSHEFGVSTKSESYFPVTICGGDPKVIKPDSLGYSYPHVAIGIDNTISLWVRRQRSAGEDVINVGSVPSPKMRVIRGPDWDKKLRDDGSGVFNRGTITKVDSTSVTVQWDGTKGTKSYKYGSVVDGSKVFEVSVIDESVGGHVFSKGAPSLFDDGEDIKWSSFGLSVLPDSRLCFTAANGAKNWFTHPSKSRLPPDEWTFVTLVTDTSKHLIYVNGELDSEVELPASLIYPEENAQDVYVVESPHPYLDNSDSYTVVDVEGCMGYTITFDEQSKTEMNYDYLRFYKDDSHSDFWGLEKYHGGRGSSVRTFPGLDGNPALYIPAQRFVVHFKSDGSNTEWGYKIYCAMEMPTKEDEGKEKYNNLNSLPFYIGQTPSYVTNIETASSIDGDICHMGLFPKALTAAEVKDLKSSTVFMPRTRLDETLCLNIISMLRRSCEIPGTPVSTALSCAHVIYSTLKLVACSSHLVSVSALRLCGVLLPNADPGLVDMQATKVGMCDFSPGCFIDTILRSMGNTFNSWRGFLRSDANSIHMYSCSEASFGIGWESVLLLHSLLESDKWAPLIVERVAHIVDTVIPSTLEMLLTISRQEAAAPSGELSKVLHVSASDLNISFGVLGMLCGAPDGLNVGAKARCTVGEGDGILEECTILSPTYPEQSDDPMKFLEPKTFGNAMVVVLDSQPTEYIVVERRNIAPTDRTMKSSVERFLKTQEARLQALFTLFVRSDCTDHRPILKPKVVHSDKEVTIQSKHPYGTNESSYKKVELKGAKAYRIEFDPQCRTVSNNDFVRFYKDEGHTEHFGESRYYGKDNAQNWPGVPGRDKPPLIINADSFVVHFKSDAGTSATDWGYKFTVKAHCVEKTIPPAIPPLIHLAVASDMKAYALKSLDFMLRSCPWFIKPVVPLIHDLAVSAMTPAPKFDVSGVAMKPLVIESAHPYENNMNSFTPYSIKGAKKLTIIFDPQTRTEGGCDHVKFFKDSSQSEMWGEQYTGGKDNGSSNWPGMNGRPPLVIPSDHFVLHFKTDSSVVDWGYKFTVIADGGGGGSDDLDKLTAADRSFRHNCIQQLLLEAPARLPYPTNLSEFETGPVPQNPLLLDSDAITTLSTPTASAPILVNESKVFRRAQPVRMKPNKNQDTEEVLGPMLNNAELMLNTDNIVCRPHLDEVHFDKMLHYCGREVGRSGYSSTSPNNNCCDGRCGPTGGCQCQACANVDIVGTAGRPRALSIDGTTRPADACPNMHALELCSRYAGWSCDGRNDPGGCKSGSGRAARSGSRWRCEQCDFDYCGRCLSARLQGANIGEEKKINAPVVDVYFVEWPASFIVNGNDCTTLKLYFGATTTSTLVATVGAWEAVTALSENGDWLRVTTSKKLTGWAQRKNRDLVYLLPDVTGDDEQTPVTPTATASATSSNLVTIEDDAATGPNVSFKGSSKHPMFEVLNDVVAKTGAKKTVLPAPSDVLKGRSGYIESAAMMASTVSSIGYAKSSVATCLANWPTDCSFSVDYFGGETLFLSYVRAAFAAKDSGAESGVADLSDLNAVKSRILDLIRAENQAGDDRTCSMLVSFSLRQLNDSLSMNTALRPTKAVVKHLESIHPYVDNMDQMYELTVPGAKWLKIVFDKQSSTEKDCDYVEVYKDRSKSAKWSTTKFTGRASSGDKCWPGVNSTPPLIVKNDNCWLSFHTDSSNTDWGWKLTCYGVMEEPTPEEVAAYEEKQSAPDRPRPDMAYWLLDFLAMEQSPQAHQVLFSSSTIKTLREVMDSMPNSMKTPVIHLITNMLQTIGRVDVSEESKSELEQFRKSVVSLADSLHLEEARGADDKVSQVLQAVMQAVIVFDTALAALSQTSDAKGSSEAIEVTSKNDLVPIFRTTTEIHELQWDVSADRRDVEMNGDGALRKFDASALQLGQGPIVVLPGSPPEKSMFSKLAGGFNLGSGGKSKPAASASPPADPAVSRAASPESVVLTKVGFLSTFGFNVKVESIGNVISPFTGAIGITDNTGASTMDDLLISWSTQRLSVRGHELVPFGPLVNTGDVISVSVNIEDQTVDFYRNFAYVGLAVGPPGSGAVIETSIFEKSTELYPGVKLYANDCTVRFVNAPKSLYDNISQSVADDNASRPSPEWIQGYLDTSNLLQACSTRAVPSAMLLTTFLPQCEESKKVVFESSHPFLSAGRKETVRIDAAQKLVVNIDSQTKMNDGDVIRLKSATEEIVFSGLEGGTQSELLNASICAGDRVVRGPAWTWGDQDGGIGNCGTVVNVLAWKGVPGTAVEVQWDIQSKLLSPSFAGMYRWGYEDKYDVLCISRGVGKRPLIFDGDSLSIEVCPADSAANHDISEPKNTDTIVWKGCQRFDGSSSLLRLETDDSLELAHNFTVESWVRLQNTDGYVAPIISRQIEMEERQNQFSLALVKQDDIWTIELSMLSISFQPWLTCRGGVIPVDTWCHVAATLSGNVYRLYIDGVEVGTGDASGDRSPSMGAALVVGANEGGQYFKGHLYDLRVWNVSRSAADILDHKNAPLAAPSENIVLSLRMDEDLLGTVCSTSPQLDRDVTQPVLPTGTLFGYKLTIRPMFTLQQVSASEVFKSDLDRLVEQYSLGSLRHDASLTKYVNQVMRERKKDIGAILSCTWSEIAPSGEEMTRWPVLEELRNSARPSAQNTPAPSPIAAAQTNEPTTGSVDSSEADSSAGPDPLELRFKFIQLLNKKLHTASMKYIDLCMSEKPWSIAYLLVQCRGVILEAVKSPFWETALSESSESGGQFDLRLSRSRAIKHSRSGVPDHDGRFMTFSQAFRAIHPMNPGSLRRSGQLYNTIFLGEYAQDVGGPYRESFAQYCAELQSSALPLLVRTPNGKQSAGQNREMWLLNPGATSLTHMEMYSFLGKLMGIAIRGKEYLALNIAPFIWKLLVKDIPTSEDLEGIDYHQVKVLKEIRHTDMSPEIFSSAFEDVGFTCVSTDDRTVDLMPNGQSVALTYENRVEYCNLLERYRLHEFDQQAEAIRRGLATVVPMRLLSLFSWDQLELMVCGMSTVDVALLRSVTEYSSCNAHDQHVRNFWQVLEEFTEEEKAAFLKFTWGRSRLPLNAAAFAQRFKLQSFGKSPADNYLPVSHTCFFSLELPRYSTIEVMREKLRFAITHCLAIDGDDTSIGMQAAAMGWEE